MPTSGFRCMQASILSSHPSVTTTSLLSSSMKSPVARSMPWLFPAAKPLFSRFQNYQGVWVGLFEPLRNSTVPSVEPLSTRMTWWFCCVCSTMLDRHPLVYSSWLYVRIMMDVSAESLRCVGASAAPRDSTSG